MILDILECSLWYLKIVIWGIFHVAATSGPFKKKTSMFNDDNNQTVQIDKNILFLKIVSYQICSPMTKIVIKFLHGFFTINRRFNSMI